MSWHELEVMVVLREGRTGRCRLLGCTFGALRRLVPARARRRTAAPQLASRRRRALCAPNKKIRCSE